MKSVCDNKIHVDMSKLSQCVLLNADGTKHVASSLWEHAPAILVFLRHFACDACRRHATEVWEKRDLYQVNGAKIHFVGNGDRAYMVEFQKKFGLQEASFFTDPTLKAFDAAGFRRGFWIDPGEMHRRGEFLWLAVRHQMRQTGSGNVWQLGGILAVCPGGRPTYQFTSQTMGHFPPADDIPKMHSRSV
jgi:peroxiredoxin